MASRHLLSMENKGYSSGLGTFLMGGNGYFTGYLGASNSVAVNSIESSWLYCALSCNRRVFGMETADFEELYGLGQWSMTKELAREVSGSYLSSPCEVWWIAESVLNMSRSRADGTMSSWLLYFRNFTNFHTVSYIIWTPLWTKCASAATILSNISADDREYGKRGYVYTRSDIRHTPSHETTRPLDNKPPVSGRLAPSLWTISPQSLDD